MSTSYRLPPRDPSLRNFKIGLLVVAGIMSFGFVAYLIQYLNLKIEHTVLKPPSMPGMLTSMRYSLRYWLIFLAVLQGLLIFSALGTSLFSRKNSCCSGFWLVIFVLCVVAFVIFFIVLVIEGSNCNEADQPGNICNHPLRCCDPAFNGNPASGCTGPTTCPDPVPEFPDIVPPITIDKLPASPDFVWLVWTTLAFVILDIVLLVITLCINMWEPSSKPDDPLESSFTTTGSYAIPDGMPLQGAIETAPVNINMSAQRQQSSSRGTEARKRVSLISTGENRNLVI